MGMNRARAGWLCVAVALVVGSWAGIRFARGQAAAPAAASGNLKRVLVFSKTGWFRHPEIPKTNGWLVEMGVREGYKVDVTETAEDITPARLKEYQVLILNNSNAMGEVMKPAQLKAIEDFYKSGHGIVGLHAALVHQTATWPWLTEIAGADFDSDSDFSKVRVTVDPAAKDFPGLKGMPAEFEYSADWHNHTRAVTGLPGFQVLLRVDESTYQPVREYFRARGGKAMGKDHPCAWTHVGGGGRFFYTDLGHDLRSWDTPFGKQFIAAAVKWAAGEGQ